MNCSPHTGMIDTPLFAASESVWFSRFECSGQSLYRINDSPTRSMAFDDLTGLYLKESSRSIYCCSIRCAGKSYQICRLNEDEFWEIVKGKRFKVIIDVSTKLIRKDAFDMSLTLADNINKVFTLLDAGMDEELRGRLKKAPCFQFVEIVN